MIKLSALVNKKLNILLLFLLLAGIAKAQADTSFKLVKTIKGDIVAFTIDNLDNIYLLSSTNQVKKLNANGDSIAIFNDVKKFGQATLIDVSNPAEGAVVLQRFCDHCCTGSLPEYPQYYRPA